MTYISYIFREWDRIVGKVRRRWKLCVWTGMENKWASFSALTLAILFETKRKKKRTKSTAHHNLSFCRSDNFVWQSRAVRFLQLCNKLNKIRRLFDHNKFKNHQCDSRCRQCDPKKTRREWISTVNKFPLIFVQQWTKRLLCYCMEWYSALLMRFLPYFPFTTWFFSFSFISFLVVFFIDVWGSFIYN